MAAVSILGSGWVRKGLRDVGWGSREFNLFFSFGVPFLVQGTGMFFLFSPFLYSLM